MANVDRGEVLIDLGTLRLQGDLNLPQRSGGIVVFAHGSGSGRHSPRNRYVADLLNASGLATLVFDLLTAPEELSDRRTRQLRFDIPFLARRLSGAIRWLSSEPQTSGMAMGLFGASTGAAAALIAAADRPDLVRAIVSRGGRPDLAAQSLSRVRAPTLLLVGSQDYPVIDLNRKAAMRMTAPCHLEIVPGATHLFEEPGKLEIVASLAASWFRRHLLEPARVQRSASQRSPSAPIR